MEESNFVKIVKKIWWFNFLVIGVGLALVLLLFILAFILAFIIGLIGGILGAF